jgi:nucleoside-diphosphate-sugar epimerase
MDPGHRSTSVTGFIAGHVVEQLLQLEYRVRGSVLPVHILRPTQLSYSQYSTVRTQRIAALGGIEHPSLEFVEVNVLAKTTSLVHRVVHHANIYLLS